MPSGIKNNKIVTISNEFRIIIINQNRDNMKIELKRISFSERMSEETNCFTADLYINGKKVGYCENRGFGGCTDYRGDTDEGRKLIKEAEAYCKALPPIRSEELNFEYPNSLENTIDEILEEHLKAKDTAKIEKKMQKRYATAICYGKKLGNGYDFATTFWKGRTLASIPLPYLQKAYDEVKAKKMQKGDVILNDNLEALGVKL